MTTAREAMIVAGGAGTRLRPLTASTPKPLLPFCDTPFLAGVVARLAGFGVRHVLLVVGRDTAPFERLGPIARSYGVTVRAVPEPEPLDTAGGVRSALEQVSGTFLVLNGDILTDVDLGPVVDRHLVSGAGASLLLTRVEDTSTFGVCLRRGTRVVGFVEKPSPGWLPDQDTVNAGTYVFEPEVLARFPPGPLSFERDVFPTLVDDGVHIEGVVGEGVWADLGTPERYLYGHRLALDGALAWPPLERLRREPGGVFLGAGVRREAGVEIEGPVLLGDGVQLDEGCRIGPYAVLGSGVRVAAGGSVRDSVVMAGATLGPRSRLAQVVVGSGAEIGPGVVAERGAVIGDDERVPSGMQVPAGARLPST